MHTFVGAIFHLNSHFRQMVLNLRYKVKIAIVHKSEIYLAISSYVYIYIITSGLPDKCQGNVFEGFKFKFTLSLLLFNIINCCTKLQVSHFEIVKKKNNVLKTFQNVCFVTLTLLIQKLALGLTFTGHSYKRLICFSGYAF